MRRGIPHGVEARTALRAAVRVAQELRATLDLARIASVALGRPATEHELLEAQRYNTRGEPRRAGFVQKTPGRFEGEGDLYGYALRRREASWAVDAPLRAEVFTGSLDECNAAAVRLAGEAP